MILQETLGEKLLRQAEQATADGNFADSGELFSAKAKAIGILVRDQQKELNALAQGPEGPAKEAAQTVLLLCNSRQVKKVTRPYQGKGLDPDDLQQEGAIGQLQGIKKYNPEYQTSPLSYQTWWIRQRSSREVQKRQEIPSYLFQVMIDIETKLPSLMRQWQEERTTELEEQAYREGNRIQLHEYTQQQTPTTTIVGCDIHIDGKQAASNKLLINQEKVPTTVSRQIAEQHNIEIPEHATIQQAWKLLPAEYHQEAFAMQLEQAQAKCQQLARKMAREQVGQFLASEEIGWTAKDIARDLNTPIEHVQRALDLLERKQVFLDADVNTNDGSISLADIVADTRIDVQEEIEIRDVQARLWECVLQLPPVQQMIMQWQYGLGSEEPISQSFLYDPGTRYYEQLRKASGIEPSRGYVQSQIRSAKKTLEPLLKAAGLKPTQLL